MKWASNEQYSLQVWNGVEFFAHLPIPQQRWLLAAFRDPEAVSLMQRFLADNVKAWRQHESLQQRELS